MNGKLNFPNEQEYITLNADGSCQIMDLANGSEKVGTWELKNNFLNCAGKSYRITEMRVKKHDFTGVERLAFVGGLPQDVWFMPMPSE